MDDVYDVVAELRRMDAERPAEVQAMIAAANDFAIKCGRPAGGRGPGAYAVTAPSRALPGPGLRLRFLCPHTRLRYYAEVLQQYKVGSGQTLARTARHVWRGCV